MVSTNTSSVAKQTRDGMRVVWSWRRGDVYIPEVPRLIHEVVPKMNPTGGMACRTVIGCGIIGAAAVLLASGTEKETNQSDINIRQKLDSDAAPTDSVTADVVKESTGNQKEHSIPVKSNQGTEAASPPGVPKEDTPRVPAASGNRNVSKASPPEVPKEDTPRVPAVSGNRNVSKALLRAIFVDF